LNKTCSIGITPVVLLARDCTVTPHPDGKGREPDYDAHGHETYVGQVRPSAISALKVGHNGSSTLFVSCVVGALCQALTLYNVMLPF
jgi:hypothetical protein